MNENRVLRAALGCLLALGCLAAAQPAFAAVDASPAAIGLGREAGLARARLLSPLSPQVIQLLNQGEAGDANRSKGRLQIGVGRALAQPVEVSSATVPAAEWMVLPSGWRVWSVAVGSQGALGIRVHLESVNLPLGARLVVYDALNSSGKFVEVNSEHLSARRDIWAKPVFSGLVIVECQVPPGVDPTQASFRIAELSHLYQLPTSKTLLKDAAGACENDATCYPAWAPEEDAVALIDFFDSGAEYLCTGCLLYANNVNSQPNYFLTANHCITDQTIADTMTLYWFYQTPTCHGVVPDINSVPQTGPGASLLAGSADTDFAFLRLKDSPPDGVYYAGWSTVLPSATETLTTLHHPLGDYTRISFGHEVGTDGSFWQIQWFSGVTEDGSSGSPLFDANHQAIGQLYGGTSSCADPSGQDTYGRFDSTYPSVKQWLGAAPTATAALTVGTNGSGTVSPDYNGQALLVGPSYTMTATPAPGYTFLGWSGTLVTNSPTLSFVVQGNLALEANFTSNPFPVLKGGYTGLFRAVEGVATQSAGGFALTLSSKGGFSGSLQLGAARYPMSGQFDAVGNALATARHGSELLSVQMLLDVSNGTQQITGTISNGLWAAQLLANRSVYDGRAVQVTQGQVGKYTLVIPGSSELASEPGGDSYATFTLDKAGHIRLSGALADGTRFSQSAVLSREAQFALYVPLYSGRGLLWSWLALTNAPGENLSGDLTWIKPAAEAAKYYPDGFTFETTAWGSSYSPPLSGSTPLSFTNGVLVLSGGNLPQTLNCPLALAPNNRVTSLGTNKANLSFSTSSGLFSGRAVNPDTLKWMTFSGVALQSTNVAAGWFLGTNQSGCVRLGP